MRCARVFRFSCDHCADMDHRNGGFVTDSPSLPSYSQAKVFLFPIEEESFVESACIPKDIRVDHKCGSRYPCSVCRFVSICPEGCTNAPRNTCPETGKFPMIPRLWSTVPESEFRSYDSTAGAFRRGYELRNYRLNPENVGIYEKNQRFFHVGREHVVPRSEPAIVRKLKSHDGDVWEFFRNV